MHATILPKNQTLTLIPESYSEAVDLGVVTNSWEGLRVKEIEVDSKTGAVTLHLHFLSEG